MDNITFAVFLNGILGVIVLISVAFTFALPSPNNKHKALSGRYARRFLVAVFLAQSALTLRMFDVVLTSIVAYNLFMIGSAYMLMMTVVKRYGHRLRRGEVIFAIAHTFGFTLFNTLLYFKYGDAIFRDVLLMLNIAIPIFVALLRANHYKTNSMGDKVLYFTLYVLLMSTLFAAPSYLFVSFGEHFEQVLVSFVVMTSLTMLFMLSFAVSVIHSLVSRLHLQVFTDPLTTVKNRHYFYDVAPKLAAHASRNHQHLSVVVCDIDHFKSINDRYGHVVGDKALKNFCRLVQNELRAEDTLIRMGGEEFLILSPNCDIEQANLMAERLCKAVREHELVCNDVHLQLTASFGVVEIPPNSDIFAGIRTADNALYKAKETGRNTVVSVPV